MEKAQTVGLENYHSELAEKAEILQYLLDHYNDGRRKTFFCLAVNLLETSDIRCAVERIEKEATNENSLKEKALIAVKHFEAVARQMSISLKLNKKPSKASSKG